MESFFRFLESLDADGLLSSVDILKTHDDSEDDFIGRQATACDAYAKAQESSGVDPESEDHIDGTRRRMGARKMTPQTAILFVLMRNRTGLDIIDLHALFGVEYSTACRYYVVYSAFLAVWLLAEFPRPTAAQIEAATPVRFREAFKGRNIAEIIDAHEQECEVTNNLVARRSLYSKYKNRCTNKFLGGCTPCGATSFISAGYGGNCDDRRLTLASGLMRHLEKSWTTLADKGFMMHAEFAALHHELLTPTKVPVAPITHKHDLQALLNTDYYCVGTKTQTTRGMHARRRYN